MDVQILPIQLAGDHRHRGPQRRPVTYLYEPDAGEIFDSLLPRYVEIAVYRALLESSASEQGARMTAMRNASESADDLIGAFTPGVEPGAPGGDHPGDPRGRGGRRRSRLAPPWAICTRATERVNSAQTASRRS